MSTITFDTFKFVERLEKAGISREHASAIVEAQRGAFAEVLDSNLATRGDLAEVKSELKADIATVRSDIALLRAEMLAMESRLIIKLGAFIAAAVGIVVALLKMG